MAADLDIKADRILRAVGGTNMVRLRFSVSEVLEPFRATKPRGRLSGPVPPGERCTLCAGPCRPDTSICRGCAQIEAQRLCEAVLAYWWRLHGGLEPDFAPGLIERIHDREKQIGPAAFWPRGETVHYEVNP